MSTFSLPPLEIPYYIKGTGGATDNDITINVSSFRIGYIPVPTDIVNKVAVAVETVLEDLIRKNSQSVSIESVRFENGQVYGKGTVAEKQYVIGN
jgi:hypothetical protein